MNPVSLDLYIESSEKGRHKYDWLPSCHYMFRLWKVHDWNSLLVPTNVV